MTYATGVSEQGDLRHRLDRPGSLQVHWEKEEDGKGLIPSPADAERVVLQLSEISFCALNHRFRVSFRPMNFLPRKGGLSEAGG